MSFSEDEASTPREAAKLAAAWIEDAVMNSGGATIVVVRDADTDEHLGTFDEFGFGEEIHRE